MAEPYPMRTLWTLWSAFLTTQPILAAVAWFSGAEAPVDPMVPAILPLVAVGPAGLSLGWGRLFGSRQAPTVWILRWAGGEAVGVLGFVAAFLGSPGAGVALQAAAMVLIAAQFPREER